MSKADVSPKVIRNAEVRRIERALAPLDLSERLQYLQQNGHKPLFRSAMTLADQVITHALVALEGGKGDVRFVDVSSARESLGRITQERYALVFEAPGADRSGLVISTDGRLVETGAESGGLRVNPVADWPVARLIAYVLDHEVPVDPCDMPGIAREAA